MPKILALIFALLIALLSLFLKIQKGDKCNFMSILMSWLSIKNKQQR